MKKFAKIHIEISNICNLQCSFCPPVERSKKIMSLENFSRIIIQAAPICEEVALHLMGEPLGHPDFPSILQKCSDHSIPVNLVTNGTLLKKQMAALFHPGIRQINFSLHSFTDNFPDSDPKEYLREVVDFSKELRKSRPSVYINLRLWNLQLPAAQLEKNKTMIKILEEEFLIPLDSIPDIRQKKGIRLAEKIILHFDTEFRWPSLLDPIQSTKGFCYGLDSHFGILADGSVVPCCLDKEAVINLGNCLQNPLVEILNSERALEIKQGFLERKLLEPLCQRCQYIQRFA